MVRLFACVGKDCHRDHNARAVLDALRTTLATTDTGPVRMDIQPCGCLDQCEHGPVVMAYTGSAALAKRPPEGTGATRDQSPIATYVRVTPDRAGEIIQTVLTTVKS